MHIFHRRRELTGFAATQLHECLLHRGEQEFGITVAIGGDDINTYHGVRFR